MVVAPPPLLALAAARKTIPVGEGALGVALACAELALSPFVLTADTT